MPPTRRPSGLEAEGQAGVCREEIGLVGMAPPCPVPTCQAAKILSSSFGLFQKGKSHQIPVLEAARWLLGRGPLPWTPAHPETRQPVCGWRWVRASLRLKDPAEPRLLQKTILVL